MCVTQPLVHEVLTRHYVVVFQPISGTTTALYSVVYNYLSVWYNHDFISPLSFFFPHTIYTTFATTGSVQLDVACIPHLVLEFLSAHYIIPPSVPWIRPISARAYFLLDYPGLGCVSLTPPFYITPWEVSWRLWLRRASHKTPTSVALRISSDASCRHHGFLTPPPPHNPGYHEYTSKIGIKSTYFATITCLRLMYVESVLITAELNTSTAVGVDQVPSVYIHTLFPMIYLRKLIWFTFNTLGIAYNTYHD